MVPILLIDGRYHFGDNPGAFQNATYIGHELGLPLRRTWTDSNASQVVFNVYTSDIETWADWQGHAILINEVEIGRLRDPDGEIGQEELFRIAVPISVLSEALGGDDNFILRVRLGRQAAHPGFADDFVLRRIETDGSLAAAVGWRQLQR